MHTAPAGTRPCAEFARDWYAIASAPDTREHTRPDARMYAHVAHVCGRVRTSHNKSYDYFKDRARVYAHSRGDLSMLSARPDATRAHPRAPARERVHRTLYPLAFYVSAENGIQKVVDKNGGII